MQVLSKPQVRISSEGSEINQLIDLRTNIYRSVGKHVSNERMADDFDITAYHVGVWLEDKPIATARILARKASEEWEHDRFIDWPNHWPERDKTAEVSRFAILRAHRNWRTIQLLCSGIASALYESEKEYFVACCTDELVPFYRDFFGAKFEDLTIYHTDLGQKPHHMFLCDYQQGIVGNGLSISAWLSLWPSVALRGLKEKKIHRDISQNQRVRYILRCLLGSAVSPILIHYVNKSWLKRSKFKNGKRGGGALAYRCQEDNPLNSVCEIPERSASPVSPKWRFLNQILELPRNLVSLVSPSILMIIEKYRYERKIISKLRARSVPTEFKIWRYVA